MWFREDLRLADNPALAAAIKRGPVIPVFIWAPEEEGEWAPGAASRWWLHHSLLSLGRNLQQAGSRLIIRAGESLSQLERLIGETGASAVYWNRCYQPAVVARDRKVTETLHRSGLVAESFNSKLLHEPWIIENKSGRPFQVFTPFWRTCLAQPEAPEPLKAPRHFPAVSRWPRSMELSELGLLPRIDWAGGIRDTWNPGEAGAAQTLEKFLSEAFADYDTGRNQPDVRGTSRLSPFLHFGELGPRQVWHAIRKRHPNKTAWRQSQFVAELGWREFAHHLLHHFPHTPTEPLRTEFQNFSWRNQPDWLAAWQRGRTGYPMVDAGMRELWATGWMHNRVRMITASFLVKHLLIRWQEGARWFWDTLVDADLANNTLGWQWTAGCGADAAPFFRIFNPVMQGQKFDSNGDYVRKWVPELGRLPAKWIHQPFAAPKAALDEAGVVMGVNYPRPIVPHTIARELALEAYGKLRRA